MTAIKKDTRLFEPIDTDKIGGVTICGAHQECMSDIFDAIDKRASGTHMKIYIGILSSVAVVFGLALWSFTNDRLSKVEEANISIDRKTAVIENDIGHIKRQQGEMKLDMKMEFEKLRALIKSQP